MSLRKRGKKTKEWENIRRHLKVIFEEMGITYCELDTPHACWHDIGLSFAHPRKRRNLSQDQLWHVALLCPIGHELVERLPEDQMAEVIYEIINNRKAKINEQHRYDDD